VTSRDDSSRLDNGSCVTKMFTTLGYTHYHLMMLTMSMRYTILTMLTSEYVAVFSAALSRSGLASNLMHVSYDLVLPCATLTGLLMQDYVNELNKHQSNLFRSIVML